jgi:hypothetical protein
VVGSELRDVVRTNCFGGFAKRVSEFGGNCGKCRVEFLTTPSRIGDIDAVELLGELTHRAIATSAHLSDDRSHCLSWAFTGRIGSREIRNEAVAGTSTKIKAVQHDIGR